MIQNVTKISCYIKSKKHDTYVPLLNTKHTIQGQKFTKKASSKSGFELYKPRVIKAQIYCSHTFRGCLETAQDC